MAKIQFTEPAEYDLLDIEYYIYVRLCKPQAATRIVDGILEQIERLSDYPKRCPYVADTLLEKLGLRVAWFDSYNIFYYYDEESDCVHIIRILHTKTDWKTLLKR